MSTKRLVSLVPSLTETLFKLGLDDEIVGVTDSCIFPKDKISTRMKIGNTKTVDTDAVLSLRPDLVVAGREENEKSQVEALIEKGVKVWVTSPDSLGEVMDMVQEMPDRTGASERLTQDLLDRIRGAYLFCQTQRSPETLRAACIIWKKPYMAVGAGTYIHHLMEAAGATNVFDGSSSRYPEFSLKTLGELSPDILIFPSEPCTFESEDLDEIRSLCPALPAVRNDALVRLPGESICWYGSRTPEGLETLYRTFHPGARWGFAY